MKAAIIAGCVVLSVQCAAPGAHADPVMLFLKPYKADGPTTATILDIREKCPDETMPMFDRASPDNPVWIRLGNKEYEILRVMCLGRPEVPLPRPRPEFR